MRPWQQSLLALAWKNKQLSMDPLNLPESHAVSTPVRSHGVRWRAVQGQPWTRTRWEKIPARDRHPSPCSSVIRGCLLRKSASDALATSASTEITRQGGVCLRGMKGAAADRSTPGFGEGGGGDALAQRGLDRKQRKTDWFEVSSFNMIE